MEKTAISPAMISTAISPAKILLPENLDLTAFSCVACDQFTSEKDYWETLKALVGDKPSALNLILPEIYLNDDAEKRIEKINRNIQEYLLRGVFKTLPEGFVLTVRETPYNARRIGLVGAVDLNEYDYAKKSYSLVRATEGTVKERIPPRLKIRKNAEMEFSHIMILFDDEKREINESLYARRKDFKKLYDFNLNMGGGKLEGYFVPSSENIPQKFNALLSSDRLISKYGCDDKFLFAVGDGNHSLATAKEHWNSVKNTLLKAERENHPARYALAEFVNVYDEGIVFEPIYRFITGVSVEKLCAEFKKNECGKIGLYYDKKQITVDGDLSLAEKIEKTDLVIKNYIDKNGGKVDYIHGESNLKSLVDKDENSVGVLFEKLDKQELFKYVSAHGAFPRKTFSMGEGVEKRYYLEGRRIKND